MTVGSIIALNPGETDTAKIAAAVRQLLERNGGKQVNAVRAISSADTFGPSDFMILVTGNTTITLPAASAAPGQVACIKKMDASNSTTIGATIDGAANPTLTAQYAVWLVESDGTNWNAIIKYVAPVSTAGLLLNTNNLNDVSSVSAALTNLGITGNVITHNVSEFLLAANNLSDVTAATARTNLVAATKTQTEFITAIQPSFPSSNVSRIIEKIPYGATLVSFTAKCDSGTAVGTLKINTTAVTGGALNVSSAQASTSLTAANVMALGDALSITWSSLSSTVNLTWTVEYTRTLA